jgi:hypothetical protein
MLFFVRSSPSFALPPVFHSGIVRQGIVTVRGLPDLRAARVAAAMNAQPFRPLVPGGGQAADLSLGPQIPVASMLGSTPEQTPAIPIVGNRFEGINAIAARLEPPDTQIGVGAGSIFEMVNLTGAIFDKSGHELVAPFSLRNFFQLAHDMFVSDPRVIFDPVSQRCFATIFSLNGANLYTSNQGRYSLAVSASSDPAGAFTVYLIAVPGTLPDQPRIGISADKVVLTGNAFECDPELGCNADRWLNNEFVVIDKADLLHGAADPRTDIYPPPQAPPKDRRAFTVQPVAVTTGATIYMGAVSLNSFSAIDIWTVSGVPSGIPDAPGTSVAVATLPLAGKWFSFPGLFTPAGNATVDAGDSRLQSAAIAGATAWFVNTVACEPAADIEQRSCLHLVAVDTATMTTSQDFAFGTARKYNFFPYLAADAANNLVAVFDQSSVGEFVSLYAVTRLATDPPNTVNAPILLKAGEGDYGGNRWGDYNSAAADPADPASVWVAGEYASDPNLPGLNWSTLIAQLEASPMPTPAFTPTALPSPQPTPALTATATPVTPTPSAQATATPSLAVGKIVVNGFEVAVGGAGDEVAMGKFTLVNDGGSAQSVGGVTISFTHPEILISATLAAHAGTGIESTLVPPEKTTVFTFDPALVIPARASVTCALTGSLRAPMFGRGDGVAAYAGMITPPGRHAEGLLFGVMLLGLLLTPYSSGARRRIMLLAGIVTLLTAAQAGCGGAPASARGVASSQAVTEVSAGGTFTGLPAPIGVVTLIGSND